MNDQELNFALGESTGTIVRMKDIQTRRSIKTPGKSRDEDGDALLKLLIEHAQRTASIEIELTERLKNVTDGVTAALQRFDDG